MAIFKSDHKEDPASIWNKAGNTSTAHVADTAAVPGLGALAAANLASPAALGAVPSPLAHMAEGATAGIIASGAVGVGAGVTASTTVPKKEYVDMDAKGKTNALVSLMNDSRDVLDANGVSGRGEELLAGIMRNEGGRNERRKAMGSEFNKDAAVLNKLDLEHLTDKQMKKLTPDQKALLAKAQAGTLDLHDPEAVKNAGIDIRTDQYKRMTELSQRTDLSKAEKAELKTLQGIKVAGGGHLNDFRGMSGDRFHEIFDEGQTRFELGQYTKFRKDWERQHGKPAKPGEDMTIKAGIGSAKLDAAHQAQLNQNYDLLADYSTSYGTAQIMGLYAEQGQLTSKDGKGQDHTFTLDELKGSAKRYTPNAEDVEMQLAFMNMKGIDMGHPPDSHTLAVLYNGKGPRANTYEKNMLNGANAYHNAKAAAEKPDK